MKSSDLYSIVKTDPTLHTESIQQMIQELAVFERMPDGPERTAEQLKHSLETGECHSFVALETVTQLPVAYSIYYYGYSTWQGRFLFMEDLYVKEAHRKKGVGKQLWREIAKVCVQEGMPRMCWSVLEWNTPAVAFYRQMNAQDISADEGWRSYRMDRDGIRRLADGDDATEAKTEG